MVMSAPSAAATAEPAPAPGVGPRDVGGPRQPMLIAERLTKHFTLRGGSPGRRAVVRAVDEVSFDVRKGETLGIVRESGCGKSTTAPLLIGLTRPHSGALGFHAPGVRA